MKWNQKNYIWTKWEHFKRDRNYKKKQILELQNIRTELKNSLESWTGRRGSKLEGKSIEIIKSNGQKEKKELRKENRSWGIYGDHKLTNISPVHISEEKKQEEWKK